MSRKYITYQTTNVFNREKSCFQSIKERGREAHARLLNHDKPVSSGQLKKLKRWEQSLPENAQSLI